MDAAQKRMEAYSRFVLELKRKGVRTSEVAVQTGIPQSTFSEW